MLLAFAAGWIAGSVALYTYMVFSSREAPFPECMDCKKSECGACPVIGHEETRYRLAA